MIKRRDLSYRHYRGRGASSYSLTNKDRQSDVPNYETWSGAVSTPHGFVMVYSSRWHDDKHPSTRMFVMIHNGRSYQRHEEGAPIYSAKHGAVLAGKFARDVVAGRIR